MTSSAARKLGVCHQCWLLTACWFSPAPNVHDAVPALAPALAPPGTTCQHGPAILPPPGAQAQPCALRHFPLAGPAASCSGIGPPLQHGHPDWLLGGPPALRQPGQLGWVGSGSSRLGLVPDHGCGSSTGVLMPAPVAASGDNLANTNWSPCLPAACQHLKWRLLPEEVSRSQQ